MKRLAALTPRDRAIAFVALVATALLILVVLLALRPEAPGRATGSPGATPETTARTTAPGRTPSATLPSAPTAAPSPGPLGSVPTVPAQPPPEVPPDSAAIASPVAPATTRAPATPTPSPDPNVWRVEGVLVDDATKLPIQEVCVVIGPRGCQRGSVRTDDRGVFYFDVPKNPTVLYDLYFVKDGFWTVWIRIGPQGPSVYNLALTRR